VARKLPRFLSEAEVAAVLMAAEDSPRDLMLMKCMYFLGLRNSEAQKLRIEDIDTINRVIKVVQSKRNKDRMVPVPPGFVEDLKEWIGDRREGYLFTGRSSGKLADRHIRRIVKHYARLAGVRKHEEVHPHTLRHSYATHLQDQGVPLNVIQQLLGHSRVETTTIYLHLGIGRMKEWIDKAFG
jgi:site-specific recombinase XerD